MLVTKSSVASLQARRGLPFGTQTVGWIVLGKIEKAWFKRLTHLCGVLVFSLIMPFIHRMQPNNHYHHRLIVLFLTFSPAFILLTISYEGLFYVAFCVTLVTWILMENRIYAHHKSLARINVAPSRVVNSNGTIPAITYDHLIPGDHKSYRALTLADARISLFFLFFLQSAFFSTGNIASLASFSLDAVYRLIPVFDPFSQGALLVFKIMIPFAVISANLGILNRRLEVAPSALFMVVMAMSDVMTLNFFYMVKDEGSWLDIGTTISHFCIANLLCVFVAGLEFVSESFVTGVEFEAEQQDAKRLTTQMGEKKGRLRKKMNGIQEGYG